MSGHTAVQNNDRFLVANGDIRQCTDTNIMSDKSKMTPIELLKGGESEVGIDLLELAQEVREFLLAQRWCASVTNIFYDRGFPKLAVFYAEIEPLENADAGRWLLGIFRRCISIPEIT